MTGHMNFANSYFMEWWLWSGDFQAGMAKLKQFNGAISISNLRWNSLTKRHGL